MPAVICRPVLVLCALMVLLPTGGGIAFWLLTPGIAAAQTSASAPAVASSQASAGEGIRLARHPAPSPDGSRIAFSYQGDIWIVPRAGGTAQRLTVHPAYDGGPIWSPDGLWIAFYSVRDGNEDVYVLPVGGGPVERLTWYSGSDIPVGWTPDSQAILFEGYRHIRERGSKGTFLVPLSGGTPVPVLSTGASEAALSPGGDALVYLRGSTSWWKRGYEGNARMRIWMAELDPPLGPGRAARSSTLDDRWWQVRGTERPEPEWERPACTAAAQHAAAALYSRARHLNLTQLGAVTTLPNPDPKRGYLSTYLQQKPNWDEPQIEVGSNRAPQWFPDGDHLLYLSEFRGYANLKIMSISGQSRAWVTRFQDGRLRFPRLSADGRLVAFEYEDGIYTLELPAELPADLSAGWPAGLPEPRRLEITIPLDRHKATEERLRVTSGADEYALSPDGKQIAFVYQGELFAMRAHEEDKRAYRLTESAAREEQICWSPDSKSLLFTSDRAGNRDLYRIRSTDEDEPRLARTLHREIKQLTDDEREEYDGVFSPDGAKIAYKQGLGSLLVMDADGGNKRRIVDGWAEVDFRWSPDSRWIAYSQADNDFNTEIWIISADGEQGPHNISQHPNDDYAPCWSPDGKMLAFSSNRGYLNQTDIWYVWLTLADEQLAREDREELLSSDNDLPDAGAKAKGEDEDKTAADRDRDDEDAEEEEIIVEIDFEEIHLRLHRLTTFPGSDSNVLIAQDASGFAFVSDTDGERDLWYVKWTGKDPKRVTRGGQNPQQLQLDQAGKRIFFLSKGAIKSVPFEGGDVKSYAYEGEMRIDRQEQRAFVFEEAWRTMRDHFYDSDFHGVDWPAVREKFRPWALAASTYHDFQDVIKMMIGELNSSHQSTWGGPGDWSDSLPAADTGVLGVLLDPRYAGPGLRIVHVIEGSPADRVESRLEAGEIIHAVGGQAVSLQVNLSRLLDRTVDDKILLAVEGNDGTRREVVIRPAAATVRTDDVYKESIKARQAFVRDHGNDRVAYVHISSMGLPSLVEFERDLYAQAHGKEALIIDVRGNGGGWTTDLMLTSLLAGDHAVTVPRGGGPGYPQGRRLLYAWTKPIVVLCNEHSFSNAEIFSWSIQTTGRGPVVGQRTHGGVISTGGTHLGDGSWLRLPFRGWRSRKDSTRPDGLDGSNLEGTGCRPDIVIENHPEDLARGIDLQLQRALTEALRQID